MKKSYLIFLLACAAACYTSNAQVGINTDGSLPDSTAMLDVSSVAKGLLAPRMSSTQRMAIITPASGLLVYDTTTKSFWVYKTSWTEIVSFNLPFAGTANVANAAPSTAAFRIINSNGAAGSAATFLTTSANNTGSALSASSNGKAASRAFSAVHNGVGVAADIAISNPANGSNALLVSTVGDGFAGLFINNNDTATNSGAVKGVTSASNGNGYPNAIWGEATGTLGTAALFNSTSDFSIRPTVVVLNQGLERTLYVGANNPLTAANAIEVRTSGTTDSRAIEAVHGGTGIAVHGQGANPAGNGAAGVFEKDSPFTQAYTNAANTDLEVRHADGGTVGMGGLRILNKGSNSNAWTLFTENATGNLLLISNGVQKGTFNAATGIYTPPSDARLKSAIAPMPDVLTKVMTLQPKTYYYTADKTQKMLVGFLAQSVEPIFPQAVYKNISSTGAQTYSMDYSSFGVIAVKAVQEQQHIIVSQQQQIDELKKEIDEIRKMVGNK